jgi:hypothetical protein
MSAEREQELTRAILLAVASDTGRCWHIMGPGDLADTVAGPAPLNDHGHVDGRTRAGKAWLWAQLDVVLVVCRLDLDHGCLAEEPCDKGGIHTPWRLVLTDKGRARLAAEVLTS